MALVADTTYLHKFCYFFALVLMHLVLLSRFVAQILHLFYPSSMHMPAVLKLLLHIFLLSPAKLAWSQVIK
jgi:hypothetical protein